MAAFDEVMATTGLDGARPDPMRPCACRACAVNGPHAPLCAVHAEPVQPCDCTRENDLFVLGTTRHLGCGRGCDVTYQEQDRVYTIIHRTPEGDEQRAVVDLRPSADLDAMVEAVVAAIDPFRHRGCS